MLEEGGWGGGARAVKRGEWRLGRGSGGVDVGLACLILSVRDVSLAQAEGPQTFSSHLSQMRLAGLLYCLLRRQASIDHAVSPLTIQSHPASAAVQVCQTPDILHRVGAEGFSLSVLGACCQVCCGHGARGGGCLTVTLHSELCLEL